MRTHELSFAGGASRATIAVDYGCNLYSWRVGERELLYAPPGFGTDPADLYHGGVPILFPAVGRTWDRSQCPAVPDRYSLGSRQQKRFSMPPHGFAGVGSWTEQAVVSAAAEVRAAFAFRYDEAVRERHYPFDVQLVQEFALGADRLEWVATLTNTGSGPAPFAFGYHPYFGMGLGGTTIALPCSEELHLDPDLLVPTGTTSPVTGILNLGVGDGCDCVYGGMAGTTATLEDAADGSVFELAMDAATRNVVVYSGAGDPFVCVEPWTRGLGAYEALGRDDWPEDADLEVLRPGERRSFFMAIKVRGI